MREMREMRENAVSLSQNSIRTHLEHAYSRRNGLDGSSTERASHRSGRRDRDHESGGRADR